MPVALLHQAKEEHLRLMTTNKEMMHWWCSDWWWVDKGN